MGSYNDPHAVCWSSSGVSVFLWLSDIEEWQVTNDNKQNSFIGDHRPPTNFTIQSLHQMLLSLNLRRDLTSSRQKEEFKSATFPSNSNDRRVTFSWSATGTKASFFCHILGHLQRKHLGKKWEAAELGVLTPVLGPHRSVLHLAGSPVGSRPDAAF